MKRQAKVKGDKGGRFGILARCRDTCAGRDPSTALGMPGRAAKAKCRSLDCARDDRQGRRATRQREESARRRRYKGKGDSVSASNIPAVVRYIRNQESHHKKMTFETEFLALLKKHNVEFDPKFVFG